MIDAAWQYIKEETPDEARLRARFGNRSYLSGLDADRIPVAGQMTARFAESMKDPLTHDSFRSSLRFALY